MFICRLSKFKLVECENGRKGSEIRSPVAYTRKRLPTLVKYKMDHLSDLYVYRLIMNLMCVYKILPTNSPLGLSQTKLQTNS